MLLSSCLLVAYAQPAPPLLVAAASDLIDVQDALVKGFKAQSGIEIRFTFGASGALAQQVKSGAPYDLFLSADQARVKDVVIPDTETVYAQGRIALWSKTGKITTLTELLGPGILHVAIANPAHAPYGVAARQALERAGLWTRLAGKIVYGESVRQALEYAEGGNADAVVTAWSLVINRGGILLPTTLHDPIRQAAGVVRGSRNPDLGRAFLRFLVSPEGRALLAKSGFDAPDITRP